MTRRRYTPNRGDVIWIQWNPRTGHEQSGRRPALVLTPKSYNRKTGLCILCLLTRQSKGYAFEVPVHTAGVAGVVLADHVRCVDWQAQNAQFIERAGQDVLDEIVARLEALLIDPDT
jgi:mRNA interferase MazF